MTQVCKRCGSTDVVPIVYGFQTTKESEQVEHGEANYGSRIYAEGMPNMKCRNCQSTFRVRQNARNAVALGKPLSALVLFVLVGCLVERVTTVPDNVVFSFFPQMFSGSAASSLPFTNVACWAIGLFAVIALFAFGFIVKSKTIFSGGAGYAAGFMFTAWLLGALWTLIIEVGILVAFLMAYGTLSE